MLAAGLCVLAGVAGAAGAAGTRYAIRDTLPMPGVTGWDYLAVDPGRHTLYLTDSSGLIAYDIEAMRSRGTVPKDLEVSGVGLLHAVAIDQARGRGFLVHEVPASVVVFDLASRKHVVVIPTDPGPDAMVFDAATDRLFVMSSKVEGVHTVTVIDAATLAVITKIALPGRPEFAVTDGAGSLFVNLADRKAIARLDTRAMEVVSIWPLPGCSEPSGLAIDIQHVRLFASCDNSTLAMVDSQTGTVLATIPTGEGTDAVGFDASTDTVFASNGESATLTVAHEDSPSTLRVLQQLPTAPGARTLAVDAQTHRVFLLAGEYGDAPKKPSKANPHRYPLIRTGTARLLVVSPAGSE